MIEGKTLTLLEEASCTLKRMVVQNYGPQMITVEVEFRFFFPSQIPYTEEPRIRLVLYE